MKKKSTTDMVMAGIFIALICLLGLTPGLGYIPLGVIRITTVHIPVIIGAILLGPGYGALLGGMFGLTSFINNTFSPVITSFVFTPFYTLGEAKGNLWSLVICFVPRILIGVVAYYVYIGLKKLVKSKNSRYIALMGAGIAGSLTNTILVMNLIYFCFGKQYALYAKPTEIAYDTLYTVIIGVIAGNGIPEAIGAAILVTAIGGTLLKLKNIQ